MKKIFVQAWCILFTLISTAQMQTYSIHFDDEIHLGTTSFRGADFNYNTALVSGSHGKVFKASLSNASLHWEMISLPSSCDSLQFRDVAILSETDFLLMSAGEGALAQIWKSTDSGKQWHKVYQNVLEKAFFNGFDFWDDKHGVLISDPIDNHVYLLETKDAGNTWQRIHSKSLPILTGKEYGFAASGTGIQCFGSGNIVVGTGGAVARIFQSKDYGKSWQISSPPMLQGADSKGIFSIHFLTQQLGIAVGGDYANDQLTGNNVVQLQANGDWKNVEAAKNVRFKSCVQMLNKDWIIATGTSGTVISKDAGQSWIYVNEVKGYHTIAYQPDLKRGFMAGSDGRVVGFCLVIDKQ